MFEIIGHILPVRSRSERFKQNKLCFGGFSCMAVCLSVRLSEMFVCVSGEDSKEGEIFAVMWLRARAKKRRVCSSPCSHRIYIRDIEMCVCVVG